MKKFLLSLGLVVGLGTTATISATESMFTLADLWKYTNTVTEEQITSLPGQAAGNVKNSIDFKEEGVTLTSTDGLVSINFVSGSNKSNGPIYYNTNGTRTLRVYKNNVITITSAEDLTNITITSPNNSFAIAESTATKNITASEGAFSGTKGEAKWSAGKAGVKTVTFTVGSTASTVQMSSICVNPVEPETPVETEEVADIAAFIAKADKINPVIIKNAVEVIYQIGTNLFVKDNSGRILIYGKIDQTYQSGDSIPGGFQGVYGVYGGNPQVTKAEGLEAAFGHNEVAPRVVTLAEITADDVFDYVEINGVTFAAVNNRNITFKQGETEFAGYNQFNSNVTLPTDFEGKTYNIKAIIGSFNGNVQVQPVEIEEAASSAIDEIGADENAPVEYFNLQGIRVDNPEAGLYIRRQGSKVSKVVIR